MEIQGFGHKTETKAPVSKAKQQTDKNQKIADQLIAMIQDTNEMMNAANHGIIPKSSGTGNVIDTFV